MQKAANIVLKQPEPMPSGGVSPELLARLEDLMVSTRRYFPHAKIDEGTVEEYAKEWIAMAQQFGMERFEKGLTIAKKWKLQPDGLTIPREFFPMPAEIEQFITTQTFSPTYAKTDPNCAKCRGNGYEDAGEKDGNRTVKPCECRRIEAR